jgi:hypothetical protein
MTDQMFLVTQVYRKIIPNAENLEDLNDIAIKMEKAALARDKIKALILKDKETESKIQGTDSGDFSIFEEDERLSS